MNQASEASLAEGRGNTRQADGFITGCAVSRDCSRIAFATGDGVVHLFTRSTRHWQRIAAHDGSILCLAQDLGARDFLTGGDDNRLCRIAGDDASVLELARGRRWVEQVASVRDGAGGWIASTAGKQVELRGADDSAARLLAHSSSVSGLAFDAKGKRLAVSHYGGVSFRFTNAKADAPRLLEWKGSHIAVAINPAGDAVVTAMQENELHGWRLADGHHMRMSGYPQKTRALSFSRNGRWLATSGADAVVLWPFFGGGPSGKTPMELGGVPGVICTRALFHPQHETVAAGFADGTVTLSEVASGRVLKLGHATDSPISALAFSADGATLVFGDEAGLMSVVDLSAT